MLNALIAAESLNRSYLLNTAVVRAPWEGLFLAFLYVSKHVWLWQVENGHLADGKSSVISFLDFLPICALHRHDDRIRLNVFLSRASRHHRLSLLHASPSHHGYLCLHVSQLCLRFLGLFIKFIFNWADFKAKVRDELFCLLPSLVDLHFIDNFQARLDIMVQWEDVAPHLLDIAKAASLDLLHLRNQFILCLSHQVLCFLGNDNQLVHQLFLFFQFLFYGFDFKLQAINDWVYRAAVTQPLVMQRIFDLFSLPIDIKLDAFDFLELARALLTPKCLVPARGVESFMDLHRCLLLDSYFVEMLFCSGLFL